MPNAIELMKTDFGVCFDYRLNEKKFIILLHKVLIIFLIFWLFLKQWMMNVS